MIRKVPSGLNLSEGHPVAIWGNGVSGRGVANLLDYLDLPFRIYDEQGDHFSHKDAEEACLVVSSPSFSGSHPWMKIAESCGLSVIGETDFASSYCSNQIFAITGTNGKTTLTTFLGHLWQRAGRLGVVAGNVGTPLSEIVSSGINREVAIFLEVSSFQAQNLRFLKPSTLLWTNFAPDHLDYHLSLKEYFLAKKNLMNRLAPEGFAMVGSSVAAYATSEKIAMKNSPIEVGRDSIPSFLREEASFFSSYPQLENLAIAYAFASRNGIEDDVFLQAVRSYKPESHRLACIAKLGKIGFWNDSKSTNFASTIAAFKNFKEKIIWIGGGREKGEAIERLAEVVPKHVSHAFLFGEAAVKLSSALRTRQVCFTVCSSLKEAVLSAFRAATKVADILFSPGFASFDAFSDYAERGNFFEKVVFDLKNRSTPCTQECII